VFLSPQSFGKIVAELQRLYAVRCVCVCEPFSLVDIRPRCVTCSMCVHVCVCVCVFEPTVVWQDRSRAPTLVCCQVRACVCVCYVSLSVWFVYVHDV